MATRHEKGLCFNCDEKFTRGHQCSSKFFMLIAEEEETTMGGNDLVPLPPDSSADINQSPTQISFHALSGHLAPETLRLVGQIVNHHVVILIDGGSTHNFVQEQLVTSLALDMQPVPSLWVMVGNGNKIYCHHLCPGVNIHV